MSDAVCLAKIGAVYADGVTLIFDGQDTPTTKRYKYNRSVSFSTGRRVVVLRVSGTYVVAFPID